MTLEQYEDGERVSENWDTVFKSLSAEPRRQLIVSLLDTPVGQSVPLPESAAMSDVHSDPEGLRIKLYHIHLPVLEDNGHITWEESPLMAPDSMKLRSLFPHSTQMQPISLTH
jgi:hypothetical protein